MKSFVYTNIRIKPNIKMKKMIGLFLFLLMSFSLLSNDFETHIIIIGGGKTPEDAQVAKDNYLKQKELNNQIIADVKTIYSNDVKGLNPGFYIAIMGYCADEFKARLLTNFANKYIKGVYFKKVHIKKEEKSPEFYPKTKPFIGNNYQVITGEFYCFYNDKNCETILKISEGVVLVKDDKVIFSEKEGLVEVNYYIGWVQKSKQVVYLNQFQFSRLFGDSEDWLAECEVDEKMVQYGPEFEAPERKEKCEYLNGVTSFNDRGYEWDTSTFSFPADKFTFNEVLNYYAGKGNMGFLFNNELEPQGNNKYINKDGCEITYIPGKDASLDCHHEWSGVTKDKDVIEYSGGGGA